MVVGWHIVRLYCIRLGIRIGNGAAVVQYVEWKCVDLTDSQGMTLLTSLPALTCCWRTAVTRWGENLTTRLSHRATRATRATSRRQIISQKTGADFFFSFRSWSPCQLHNPNESEQPPTRTNIDRMVLYKGIRRRRTTERERERGFRSSGTAQPPGTNALRNELRSAHLVDASGWWSRGK